MTVLDFKSIKDIPFGEHRFYGSSSPYIDKWDLMKKFEVSLSEGMKELKYRINPYYPDEGIVMGIDTHTKPMSFVIENVGYNEHFEHRYEQKGAVSIYESLNEWKNEYEKNVKELLHAFILYIQSEKGSMLTDGKKQEIILSVEEFIKDFHISY